MNSPATMKSDIEVRHCHGLPEFEACLELERRVWCSGDVDVVPSALFVVIEEVGGQVLGAFDLASRKMIGFTLALPGFHGTERYLHSHMTAVLAEYRDRGIGRRLKLFQREDALARGIRLVEWTFDPLELRNAHFNLERLGAIVRRYLPNAYGITTSPLHGNLPTDRFMAEWWLDSPRVCERAALPQSAEVPKAAEKPEGKSIVRVIVPKSVADIERRDRNEAARVQQRFAVEFPKWFAAGYAVTGIEFDTDNGIYRLEPYAS